MKVFDHISAAAGKIKNPVVTTGSFDGVHIGHKIIINRLNQIAAEIGGESVLITFHPHPRKVLYPEQNDLRLINTREEKTDLLRKAGLDNLVIMPFSIEFSKTSSHDFVKNILVGELKAKVIVVGHNHHFGHNRKGDYHYLEELSREFAFKVEEIPLKDIENETVSSTKIRKALFEGNIQRANAYLDHQYIIQGETHLNELPAPGLNLSTVRTAIAEEEKLVPPAGIYATNLFMGDRAMKGMTMISAENGMNSIQTHLLYDSHEYVRGKGTLYFYKKVSNLDYRSDHSSLTNSLEEVREMIEDLIY